MKDLRALCLLLILALANFSIKINGSTSLRPVLTGPDMAYLRSKVAFQCIAPDSSPPITYQLMKDGVPLNPTFTNLQLDQPARLSFKVGLTSEGSYHCEAKAGGGTGISNSIWLSVVTPPSNTGVTSEPYPPAVYEGSRMVLSCTVTKGSHLFYTWYFNREEVTNATSPLLHISGNKLVIEKVTPEHAGSYYCVAWTKVQEIMRVSSSTDFKVAVKVHLLKPTISFSISKQGAGYYGNVTCRSSRGTPPVNFSLTVDDREVETVTAVESLDAWFRVDMVPGLDMGVAQCLVRNDVQDLKSEPVTLEVVPVGGDISVEVEYLYRTDSILAAARLTCQVTRGTFPFVSWLLNDSVLPLETHMVSLVQPAQPHYALTDHRRTLLLTKLGPEESGYYRCRARDSYDDSGAWVESAAVRVRVTEVFVTTTEVITIIFCCFLFLSLMVGVLCMCGMIDHKQGQAHHRATNLSCDERPLTAASPHSGGWQADNNSADIDLNNQTMETSA